MPAARLVTANRRAAQIIDRVDHSCAKSYVKGCARSCAKSRAELCVKGCSGGGGVTSRLFRDWILPSQLVWMILPVHDVAFHIIMEFKSFEK